MAIRRVSKVIEAVAVVEVVSAPVVALGPVEDAFALLNGAWKGEKMAVKNGEGVVEALSAAGWRIARLIDGDVIVGRS